ncbi:hypothetical protein COO72_05045 [Bifidobacterium callitrichos]|nr:hypothetical protein COO72_05045 [Bifidobacterium callitrichos]
MIGKRFPVVMTAGLLSICMTAAMAVTAPVALADYVDQGCVVTTPKTTGRYTVNDLKGVRAFWVYHSGPDAFNLHYFDGFDHTKVGPYNVMPSGDSHAGVRDQPSGWGVEGCASSDGTDHWTLVAPDGTKVITYIIGKQDLKLDPNQLKSTLVTVDDKVWNGWKPLEKTSYDMRKEYPNGARIRFGAIPRGWTVTVSNTEYNGVPFANVTFKAKDGDTSVASKDYTFMGATVVEPGLGNLAGVKAYRDGKPVSGFSYLTADYKADRGGEYTMDGVPDGWTMTSKRTLYRREFTYTSGDGKYSRTFTFDTPVATRTLIVPGWAGAEKAPADLIGKYPESTGFAELTAPDKFTWRLADAHGGADAIPAVTSTDMPQELKVFTVYQKPDGSRATAEESIPRLKDPSSMETGMADPLTGSRWDSTLWAYRSADASVDMGQSRKVMVEARTVTVNGLVYPLTRDSGTGVWSGKAVLSRTPIPDKLTVSVLNNSKLDSYQLTRTAQTASTVTYTGEGHDTTVTAVADVPQDAGSTMTVTLTGAAADPLQALSTVTAKVDGKPVPGFDPVKGGTFKLPAGMSGAVTLDGIPSSWKAQTQDGLSFTLTDGTNTVTYTFTRTYSLDDLKNVNVKLGGKDVPGFDYKGGTFTVDDASGKLEVYGMPAGWSMTKLNDGIRLTSPDGSVSASYHFKEPNPTYSIDDLKDIIVTADGKPVPGFDYKGGTFQVPAGTKTIKWGGIPQDWVDTKLADGLGFTVTSPDKKITVTYTFVENKPQYKLDDLQGLSATADGKTVDGFDYHGGTFTVPEGTTTVELKGLPQGWTSKPLAKGLGFTVSSPDGVEMATYTFTPENSNPDPEPGNGTANALTNVIAYADGMPVDGFDPVKGGTFTIPENTLNVDLDNVPSDWSYQPVPNQNGWFIYDMVNGQGETVVRYTFKPASTTQSYSVEDLKNVTLSADGKPVEGFDYKGGTFTVPSTATLQLAGVPVGWDIQENTDGWTVTSPDKKVVVVYKLDRQLPPASADELKNVTAWVGDKQVQGFNPVKGGTFQVPSGTNSITLKDVPEGWTSTRLDPGLGFTLTSHDKKVTVTYRFEPKAPTYSVDDLKNVTATAGDTPVDGFDYKGGVFTVPNGSRIRLDHIPEGWSTDNSQKTEEGGTIITVTSPDKSVTVSYTFNPKPVDHSVDDLKNVTATVDGKPVTGFDYRGGTFTVPAGTTSVELGHVPSDWTSTPLENGLGFTLTSPDKKITVTYTFTPAKPTYKVDDLKNVTASANGKPVTGFDYKGGTFTVPSGTTQVTLGNLPADWTSTPSKTGLGFTVTSPDKSVTVTYTFTPEAAPKPTYSVDDLKHVIASADGKPVDKFDYKGGTFTVPAGTKGVHLADVPQGWDVKNTTTGMGFIVTSPDKTLTVTYTFTPEAPQYSLDDLKGVTASANGKPVTGFDYKGGTFTVPSGTTQVTLNNLPADWTSTPSKTGLGFTVTSPDKKVTATYTFTPEKPVYKVDDLKNVTATADGKPVTGFDYKGGTFTVPAGTTGVHLDNIPAGWSTAPLANGLGFTLTAPDKSVTVTYTFTPAATPKPTYTVDDLKGVTASADGKPVTGFDYRGGTFTVPAGTSRVALGKVPQGWTSTPASNGLGFTLTAPDKSLKVTYTFTPAAAPSSTDELKDVTVGNATVPGFDATRDGSWTLPDGVKPQLKGLPAGWNQTTVAQGHGWTVTLTKGDLKVTLTFTNAYGPSDLKDVTLTDNGKPVTGFDPAKTGPYTVGKTGELVLSGIPEGWKGEGLTLTSPDGKYTITYQVNRAWSRTDLKDATIRFDGRTPDGFDPTMDGTWNIPHTGQPTITGLPQGVTASTVEKDGLMTVTVKDPDGGLLATWRFKRLPATSLDQLNGMTVTIDGKTVTVSPDATIDIGEHAKVTFDKLPQGWTATRSVQGDMETWTVTGPDGKTTAVYRFRHVKGQTEPVKGEGILSGGKLSQTGMDAVRTLLLALPLMIVAAAGIILARLRGRKTLDGMGAGEPETMIGDNPTTPLPEATRMDDDQDETKE